MDSFRKKFVEEAQDLLIDLENALIRYTPDSGNMEMIEHIFRIMHTLKGNSAMFGFNMIDQYTHQLETIYDLIRTGKKVLSSDLMDLTLISVDHIRNLLDEEASSSTEVQTLHKGLLEKIRQIINSDNQTESAGIEGSTSIPGKVQTYYILFNPKHSILSDGTNPLFLIDDFWSLGDCLIIPSFEKIPSQVEFDPEQCYISWEIILSTRENTEKIKDIFIFAEGSCTLTIQKLSDNDLLTDQNFRQFIDPAIALEKEIGLQKIKEFLSPTGPGKKEEQTETKTINEVTNKLKSISSIRVSSEKLDELINLVSELVTTQAGLSLAAEKINIKELHVLAEDVEKLTRRLRDSTFEIRLIPIENMITRFHRLVRELSHDLKKNIVFNTEGTDIELDKNMIEGLIDPIMHIIRNSIDHGLESTEERLKSGKPEEGIINFKAFHSGSSVFIQISDDGRGMNAAKIRETAIKKGLLTPEAVISSKDLLDLVFLPGFSTAQNVTNISGRGVGMDVVKRKISDLRGEVSIESTPNKGTTITLKLPLTLSIIDGLLVEIDDTKFVIPLSSIHKCFEFKHEDLKNAVNNLIFVNDGHIPFIYLRNEFGINTKSPDLEQVVVIEYGDSKIGLTVDHVIGEYQAVLKSLGTLYRKQDIVSGATILGDGTVALVLDANKVVSRYNYQKTI
ncbi:MAG TPA: chemotaxis protein CheA [Bacteroidales bacterium]|nr:chemotaxis protein CheA [Bacteroidales bacterium]